MRFAELDLIAFGPFRDQRIEFPSSGSGLHLVYGPNEAGKSTALRAIFAVLFGIPRLTADAHTHLPKDLRIGARLVDGDRSIEIVRRKGNSATLLNRAGEAMDDATLGPWLSGVDENMFRSMFGLDHVSLRSGAEALLIGKGDAGEGLFDASVGMGRVHRALEELRETADAAFTATSRTRPVNEALRTFTQAQKEVRDRAQSSDAWNAQKRGIEEAIAERDRLAEELRNLRSNLSLLLRKERVLPLLAKRSLLVARKASLAPHAGVSDDAIHRREATIREKTDAARNLLRVDEQLAELRKKRDALVIPSELLRHESAMEELQERLGGCRHAVQELPRLQAELALADEHVRAQIKAIDPSLSRDESGAIDELRIPVARQTELQTLANEAQTLRARTHAAEKLVAECERALEQTDAGSKSSMDREPLRQSIARADALGNVELIREKEERRLRQIQSKIDDQKRALGLSQNPSEAAALIVPSIEWVDRIDAARNILENDERDHHQRVADITSKRARIDADIDALTSTGSIPTEDELRRVRELRDQTWGKIRDKAGKGEKDDKASANSSNDLAAFEQQMHEADDLSDRLRREADRVATLGRLLAERKLVEFETARLEDKQAALARRKSELTAEWTQAWVAITSEPGAPLAMKSWLTRFAAFASAVAERETIRGECERIHHLQSFETEALAAAVKQVGRDLDRTSPWRALLDEAKSILRELDDQAARQTERTSLRRELESRATAARIDRDLLIQKTADWSAAWTTALTAIGETATNLSPEAVRQIIEERAELFRRAEERARIRARLQSTEQTLAGFAALAHKLAEAHAPELASNPPELIAPEIVRRFQKGVSDRALAETLDQHIAALEEDLTKYKSAQAAAEQTLARWLNDAGARDEAELRQIHESLLDRREAERALSELDEHIVVTFGGSVDALLAEAEGVEPGALSAEISSIKDAIDEAEAKKQTWDIQLGERSRGLDLLEGDSLSAEAAEKAQSALARVRDHAAAYARAKLGTALLTRILDKYRDEVHGPIVRRASELFATLTVGSFSGVRLGFDERDKIVLQCVRQDRHGAGIAVDVAGLSEGTRDQLFLALRIASLERHIRFNPAMPLVVDDILVHFDDERASAALSALHELAKSTQVLLFTHHPRIVELLRKVASDAHVSLLPGRIEGLPKTDLMSMYTA